MWTDQQKLEPVAVIEQPVEEEYDLLPIYYAVVALLAGIMFVARMNAGAYIIGKQIAKGEKFLSRNLRDKAKKIYNNIRTRYRKLSRRKKIRTFSKCMEFRNHILK